MNDNVLERIIRRKYFIFILAFSLLSCSKAPPQENILSHLEMVEVMLDLYLAEARISTLTVQPDSISLLLKSFEKSVLERRNISDSTLIASYTYYWARPDELGAIIDTMMDTLSLREQRAIKLQNP